MAGDEPSESKSEIEMVPSAKQSPAQINVQIGDDLTSSLSDEDPNSTCPNLSWFKVACRFLKFIVSFFLVLTVGAVPAAVVLVLLLIYFVALTWVQLIRHGDHYNKAGQLKFVVRFWICLAISVVSFGISFTHYILTKVIKVKQVVVMTYMELSIENWLKVILNYSMALCGIAFTVNMMLHLVPPIRLEHNESGVCFQEAVYEIADCLLFLLYIDGVMKGIPILKQSKILGVYAWKWFQVPIFVIIGYNAIRLCTHWSAWLLGELFGKNLDPATMKNRPHKLLVEKLMPREYLVYYCIGLKRNITFLLCSILTLLTWILYFGSRLSKTPQADKILHFGNQTCISVLVYSILWWFKTWVVLSWEANAMYSRLRSRILNTGSQLYFLGLLSRHNHDIFMLTYYGTLKKPTVKIILTNYWSTICKSRHDELYSYIGRLWQMIVAYLTMVIYLIDPNSIDLRRSDKEDNDGLGEIQSDKEVDGLGESKDDPLVKKMSSRRRKRTRYDLLMHDRTPTTHDIKQVAHYLISTKKALSDQTFVPSILARLKTAPVFCEKLQQLLNEKSNLNSTSSASNGSSQGPINNEPVAKTSCAATFEENQNVNSVQNPNSAPELLVTMDDWEYFKQEMLKSEDCSEISISTWLEKAQNNCLFLANALSSTKEVVDVLNTIVSCLLIGATFILWLLLTGLATTKVFVLIASPILAATFIFGETCKTLFQGIMYVYVVHPIHVGDLCSVDDKQFVVKAVGVWITTFCKVEKQGTMEEVTYPNSELATKVVVNNLTDFVWEDSLEISLGSLQKSHATELKQQIQADLDLNEKKDELVPCIHSVAIQKEEDGDFKIIIKLKYTISNIQDWSYTICKRRKEKLNTNVKQLVRDFRETLKPLT